MYYTYLFELVLIGLVLITVPNYLIYRIVTEYDKVIYIENYKHKKRPDTLLARFVFTVFSYGLMIIFLPALVYFGLSKKVERKKLIITWSYMLVTPLIGIVLPIIWLMFCQKVAMNHDLYGLNNLLGYLRILHMYISIPFYLVLAVRQMIKLTSIETKKIYEYVNGTDKYDDKSSKRKLWPKVKLEEGFVRDYLVYYKSIEEWKHDSFNIINYGFFYKMIIVFSSSIILFGSILLSTIYFDILDKPYPISPTDYHIMSSPFWGDQYIFFYTYFTLVVLVVIIGCLLMYTINSRSVLLFSRKRVTEIKVLKAHKKIYKIGDELLFFQRHKVTVIARLVLVLCLVIIMGIFSLKLYPINYNNFYNYLASQAREYAFIELDNISFDENKLAVEKAILNKNNYAQFTNEEKYGYVMTHPEEMIDDLNELNFIDEESSVQKSYVYRPENNDYYLQIPFDKEARELYPDEKYNIYIYIYETGFGIKLSGRDIPNYGKKTVVTSKTYTDTLNGYSQVENKLYDEMIESVNALINTLFAMEMEDQGIKL